MQCPKCRCRDTQVVDSRDAHDGVRRRRECLQCKERFTTYERVEAPQITVIKKDGNRERFDAEKIRRGVRTSCKNRPVTSLQIDEIVDNVERLVYQEAHDEITSQQIGHFVRNALREIDEVAYVRFVSVYEAFSTLDQFSQTIDNLPGEGDPHAAIQ